MRRSRSSTCYAARPRCGPLAGSVRDAPAPTSIRHDSIAAVRVRRRRRYRGSSVTLRASWRGPALTELAGWISGWSSVALPGFEGDHPLRDPSQPVVAGSSPHRRSRQEPLGAIRGQRSLRRAARRIQRRDAWSADACASPQFAQRQTGSDDGSSVVRRQPMPTAWHQTPAARDPVLFQRVVGTTDSPHAARCRWRTGYRADVGKRAIARAALRGRGRRYDQLVQRPGIDYRCQQPVATTRNPGQACPTSCSPLSSAWVLFHSGRSIDHC